MTFQENVRATFYWRRFAKKASVVALAVTFFTSLSISSESSPILAYLLLLNMAVLVGVVFYFTTSPSINLFGGTRWYRLSEIWRPILLGLIVVLLTMIVLFVAFGFPVAEGSVGQKFRDVMFWAITVGFIEEYVRWTWLQTLPYSVVLANAVWVLMHPAVAVVLNGESPNWFFAVFAFTFGILATLIMYLYETPLAYGFNRYLGPIMAATLHAGFNSLVTIWKVELVVPGAGQVLFGPMSAPAIVGAGLVLLLSSILCVFVARARGRRRIGARRLVKHGSAESGE